MSKAQKATTSSGLQRPGVLLSGVGVVVLLFWIGFTDSVKVHELMLGACATGLTLLLFFNILRTQELHFHLRFRDLLLVWRVPQAILKDSWVLTVVLFRDLTGKERAGSFYRACGFRISTRDPVLVGRAALAVAYVTASPNMMVIGIDPAQSLMLFHQLKRDAVPVYAQALGAAGQHAAPAQRGDS